MRRRDLLRLLAGAVLLPRPAVAATQGPAFLTTRRVGQGEFHVTALDQAGAVAFTQALPDRGHGVAVHGDRAVVFARRPGRFALVLDTVSGRTVRRLAERPDRHFEGHGVFAPDGEVLYATENDFAGQRAVVGVHDVASGFTRIGEVPTGGIGAHDIDLLPDGRTLVVANGGILTHPDLSRVKLNLPTMRPSLAYLDRADGSLVDDVALPPRWHQASLRHLAVSANGLVAIAAQYEGPEGDLVPLVATHRRGEALRPLEAPPAGWRALRQYCGDIAFSGDGTVLVASSPPGGMLALWRMADGAFLGLVPLADGCGLAQAGAGLLATSGHGAVARLDSDGLRSLASHADSAWDNHVSRLF